MMNKLVYHSGFAAMGISLLVGMAVLQANGLKTSGDLALNENQDAAAETPPEQADAPQIALANVPAPMAAPKPIVTQKPVYPASRTGRPAAPASRIKAASKTRAVSLENAKLFAIYDSHHKAATKRLFKITPNGLRNAEAYYKQLARRSPERVVINAEINGAPVSVPAGAFRKYIKDSFAQE